MNRKRVVWIVIIIAVLATAALWVFTGPIVGVMAPAGTDPAIVARLEEVLTEVATSDEHPVCSI